MKAVTEVKNGLGKLVEELNIVHEKLDNSEERNSFIFSELERLTDEVDKSKINFQELKNFCFLENTHETESIKKIVPKEVNVVQINCPFIESLGEISTLEYRVK